MSRRIDVYISDRVSGHVGEQINVAGKDQLRLFFSSRWRR